jgi:hypothetical protein
MIAEEFTSFSDRVASCLGATLESIAYYPHPFTNGGLILVFRRETRHLTNIIPDIFRCRPPIGLSLHFLRRNELFQLSLGGMFRSHRAINQQPHLAFWLKHKGTLLYGRDIREEVSVNADLPGLLLNHIEACLLHLRPRTLLYRLSTAEYELMLKAFDTQLRHLMGTALLVHNCWDVTMDTIPGLFAAYYPDELLRRAWEELTEIRESISEVGDNDRRQRALEAAWLCESFLLLLRGQSS